ncbi:MAG: PEP-CTERM sorting domain-containing protein [Armatimonadetes bacterium]|nr:PEP-CTERM sorting domain-containing protein [Armatimonadota bacterium]
MKRIFVLFAIVGMVCSGYAYTMPPNPFLVKPANSVGDLVGQIKRYPTVSHNYERHFGMTQSEVIAYMKSLKLTTLPQGGMFLVYNVPQSTGILRSKVLNLKKGTKIWVDWQGQPVLQWICGNPMTRGPKQVATDTSLALVTAGAPSNDVISGVEPMPTDEGAPIYAQYSEPSLPSVVETEVPIVISKSRSNDLSSLALIPILGAFALSKKGGDDEPNPVPEPATMVIVGTGLAYIVSKKRNS